MARDLPRRHTTPVRKRSPARRRIQPWVKEGAIVVYTDSPFVDPPKRFKRMQSMDPKLRLSDYYTEDGGWDVSALVSDFDILKKETKKKRKKRSGGGGKSRRRR